jgi:exodeoxyribonuclease VII small subunit
MDTDPGAVEEETFEGALHQLEQVVEDLERGEAGLSEALASYERGVRLLARCQAELERAERSVALLTGVDEAGNPVTAPFDPAETAPPDTGDPAPASAPARKSRKRPAADPPDGEPYIPF